MEKNKEKVRRIDFIPTDCQQVEHRTWEFTQLYLCLRLDPVATQRQNGGGCQALIIELGQFRNHGSGLREDYAEYHNVSSIFGLQSSLSLKLFLEFSQRPMTYFGQLYLYLFT